MSINESEQLINSMVTVGELLRRLNGMRISNSGVDDDYARKYTELARHVEEAMIASGQWCEEGSKVRYLQQVISDQERAIERQVERADHWWRKYQRITTRLKMNAKKK